MASKTSKTTPEKRHAITGASVLSKTFARAEAALEALDEPDSVVSIMVIGSVGSFTVRVEATDVRGALLRAYDNAAADLDDAAEKI